MPETKRDPARYRPCVGIILVNAEGLIFTGERTDAPGAWQMPQGGIDKGESIEQCALRELREEIGTDKADILAVSAGWYFYDLPAKLQKKLWRGGYLGQRQRWVLVRFTGTDDDIDLTADRHQEFGRWRWATPEQVIADIVDFKRATYDGALAELLPTLSDHR